MTTAHRRPAPALTALVAAALGAAALAPFAPPAAARSAGSPGVATRAAGSPGAVARAAGSPGVVARAETPPLFDDEAGGNANGDDPAIWRNPARPDRSLVIATAKEGGLRVYDLAGREVQAVPPPPPPRPGDAPGRFNNVDLLPGVRFPDGRADVAIVSDRGRDQVRAYRIDPASSGAPLRDVTDPAVPFVFSADQDEVNEQSTGYGIAAWRDRATGRSYAVVSRRHRTTLALARLGVTARGTMTYAIDRTAALPSSFRLPNGTSWTPCGEPGEDPHVEGMVVDPATGTLYAGQEDVGIWRMPATLDGGRALMDRVREYGVPGTYDPATEECVPGDDPGFGGDHVAADVEGLTIADDHLIVSSQGDDRFVAYERDGDNSYEGDFAVVGGAGRPDGSQECDGAAATTASLGSAYPDGLLVVHDGHNTPDVIGPDGEPRTNTDFKLVDWADVADAADL